MTYTMQQLQRELDRCKSQIFLRRGQAHLASLICSVSIIWAEDARTAYTNGMVIAMNPVFIMALPVPSRETVLAHELWHIAMMHMVRGEGKVWWLWQIACDYWINNMLHNAGYSFEGLAPWLDHRYDGMAVEDIYDDLVLRDAAGTMDDPGALWGYTDTSGMFDQFDLIQSDHGYTAPASNFVPPTNPNLAQKMANAVVQSTQYAAQVHGGWAGNDPIADMIKQFLQPKVLWEKEVGIFMNALEGLDYSWSIPNRRIRHTYLPSLQKTNKGGLDHIRWYGDSSGSMTKAQLVRWNSEARYLKKRYNPEKFTIVNFDDDIQMEIEMTRRDAFEEIKVMGRGGTDLNCVREDIIKHRPSGVIIFSDMACAEMEPLPRGLDIPTLWIVLNNPGAKVPHGKMIHISE